MTHDEWKKQQVQSKPVKQKRGEVKPNYTPRQIYLMLNKAKRDRPEDFDHSEKAEFMPRGSGGIFGRWHVR